METPGRVQKQLKICSEGYNNDFTARINRSISINYSDANHHTVAVLNGDKSIQVLEIEVQANTSLKLRAEGFSDPDGNPLIYSLSYYNEPSTYNGSVIFQDSSSLVRLNIPKDAGDQTIHIILEIQDDGIPNLYGYLCLVINVIPKKNQDLFLYITIEPPLFHCE